MKNQLSFLISILLWLIPIHSVNAQGICGNRVVEGREECDDGNLFHCDGCSANCQKSPNLEMKSLIENLSFELGSKQTNISMPIRKIDFKTGFQFAQREVTVADYKYCQAQGGCSSIKPSLPNQLSCTYKGDFRRYQNLQQYDINQMPSDDQIPLNCITWQEAQQFAKWCSSAQSNDAIKASLPTEAQFEFVAKNSGKNIEYANTSIQNGVLTSILPSCQLKNTNYYEASQGCRTRQIAKPCTYGSYLQSNQQLAQTKDGICDISGNLAEWMLDSYIGHYQRHSNQGLAYLGTAQEQLEKSIRGGSWYDIISSRALTTYARSHANRDKRSIAVGFRIACWMDENGGCATHCGDGIIQTGEICDHGRLNSNEANASCRTNCLAKRCGDGIIDIGESCDDGNQNDQDGCDQLCQRTDESEVNLNIGDEMITIDTGSFIIGDQSQQGSIDTHLVTISKPFRISKTEVTVAQYQACVEANVCSVPLQSHPLCNWNQPDKANHPINCIDWNQARTFARWQGGDLPTEAEWEYVARNLGQSIVYPWGNMPPNCQMANYESCVSSTSSMLTVKMYQDCMATGICQMPILTEAQCHFNQNRENLPINCIGVKQSLILSKWFNPSAFSNLDLSIYPWQDESICQMTNQYGCIGSTASVCSNTLGNSKQSICDLAGNVYEWVRDEWQVNLLNSSHLAHMPFCNDENCESSEVNRQSIEINRVQRGGSFLENARFLKTTTRRYSSQNIKSPLIGFRWIKYLNE